MKKEDLYNDLKRQILTMELEPGSSLDETRLSEQYAISRTPLRDVFRRLAGEGYLEIINNRGAMVSSMNHKTLRNFFLTAPMLYAAIGRLAAENASSIQIDEMCQAQDKFRQAVTSLDTEGMVFWNDRYHNLMGQMADNPYLKPSYERLLIDHGRISQTFYRPRSDAMEHDLNEAVEHHDAMIKCIKSGNSEEMVELICEHWKLSKEHIEMYVRPDPLPLDMLSLETEKN
ncbi:MAG: GntR family transcriptional regulator [Gammaproteobacteria bacterium]|jgi:DNA-binding GntR family transcriptional regulator|nr:GntR family transcriptional regulator [Gammaproteobacteria bacterium]MBT3724516.1 GntR family transcriptional regulator [Gammaproteobacteria bacterium]MBT4078059.1 GntR family transcriptional regulator [Gammaproteobacteria bacterium]MBT4194467.1 GntR family transcriptional regulator [Gammaproteobacteria bacterium]MBT4451149.1 GntR family transcriptional regulator [Gammaproteobacteria bacterium]